MTLKYYLWVTLSFLLVAGNLWAFEDVLQLKRPFLYGVFTGMLAVWVVFTVTFFRERKKPSYRVDERLKFIVKNAGFYTFLVFYLAVTVLTILAHSAAIELNFSAKQLCTWMLNAKFLVYITFFIILSRRY
jgi:hypothetical protein